MKKEILSKLHNIELQMMDEIDRICSKYNLTYFIIAGSLIGAVRHKGFIPWDDDLDIAMPREDYEKFIRLCSTELNSSYIIDSYETSKIYYRLAAKVRLKNSLYVEDFLENYKGNQGIWIDILPLDFSVNKDSLTLKFQAALKSTLQVAIEKKIGIRISNKEKWKQVIATFVSLFLPVKTMIKLQTRIMKMQNSKKNLRYVVNLASKYGYKRQIFEIEKYFPAKKMRFEDREYFVPNEYDYILKNVYGDYMKIPPVEAQEIHNPVKIKFPDGEEYCYEEI